jgi:hypothetical protein
LKRTVLFTLAVLIAASCFGFAADKSDADKSAESAGSSKFGVGVGVKVSTLGIGGEVAVPVTRITNVRFGFNAFNYNHSFDSNGITYNGQLGLRSFQTQFDIFPFGGGFHLSPGVMLYNGNNIDARTSVGAGQTFELNTVTYRSSPTNPLLGTGKMSLNKVGPMFTLGWGNLVSRKPGKHVIFGFEAGFVYQGSPDVRLNFTGSACDPNGLACRNVASDPRFQSDLLREQKRLSDKASPFSFYPIVSTGIGYRF